MPQKSKNGGEIVRSLPPWYPKSDDTGIFELIDVIGQQFDNLDDDIAASERATYVQTADTVAQLAELAKMVSLRPRENEPKESFRSRLLAEYQLNTCEGTADDILTVVSEILNVDYETIGYEKSTENGVITLTIPGSALSDLNISISDFSDIVNDLIAAGYRVDVTEDGTLKYTDPATHDATTDWSTTPGYDTLDANGDPTGSGGTYSGLL